MAINVADNFSYKGSKPLDARIKYESVAAMAGAATADLYDGCLAYVTATKKYYTYDSSNTTDPTTGKWREYSSGGGGGTTVVANPEGEATDELEKLQVGNDIYSIPEENVEINKAQFDALPAATKNNGKAYFIPDANLVSNFTVMGNRFDKANIYDTTERMVGRWIDGKPIYKRTVKIDNPSSTGDYVTAFAIQNLGVLVKAEGVAVRASSMCTYAFNGGIRPEVPGNYQYSVSIRYYNNNIEYLIGSYTDISTLYVTIQYTKTTDASVAIGTENDYSTDEMIIGTWIDGKPIYQKTVTIDSLPNAATTEYDVGLTNVSYVNISGYVLFPSGNKTAIPYVDVTNVNSSIEFQGNANGKVAVAVRADRRTCSAVLTLQYTKTTD